MDVNGSIDVDVEWFERPFLNPRFGLKANAMDLHGLVH